MHLRQGPAQPGFRKVAHVVRSQFFFSAFLRCMLSGTGTPAWVNVPVIAEASLFNVPSEEMPTAFISSFTVSPVRAMLATGRPLAPWYTLSNVAVILPSAFLVKLNRT